MSNIESSSDEEISPYPALNHLIELAHRDRRTIRRARKALEAAAAKFKEDFPDYAVLMALVEQAEQDQQAINTAVERMEAIIQSLDESANNHVSLVATRVSSAVERQIATSIADASNILTEDLKKDLQRVRNAASEAERQVNRLAIWAFWQSSLGIIFGVILFLLGVSVGCGVRL